VSLYGKLRKGAFDMTLAVSLDPLNELEVWQVLFGMDVS
jgi:hypothetical protein